LYKSTTITNSKGIKWIIRLFFEKPKEENKYVKRKRGRRRIRKLNIGVCETPNCSDKSKTTSPPLSKKLNKKDTLCPVKQKIKSPR